MKNLMIQLLMMSLFGGAAALLALAVSALLRKLHTPSRWLCLLWGVAAIRFVLPGGIPIPALHLQSERLAQTLAAVQNNAPATVAIMAALPTGAATQATATATVASATSWDAGITVWHFLAAAWFAGSAVLFIRAVLGYARMRRQLDLACKTVDGCYTCAAVDVPFTFGIMRPRIFMPQSLQGESRRTVLLHERTHISHGDTITKPLAYLVACIHWWNPLAWLTFRQLERTMEASCDEAAIREADKTQRTRYCENILKFAQRTSVPGSLGFGQGRVKDRVRHVLGFHRPAAVMLALCAGIALLAATACMAQPTVETASADSAAVLQPEATLQPAATVQPAATAQPALATQQPQAVEAEQPAGENQQAQAAQPSTENQTSQPAATAAFLCPVNYTYISRYRDSSHRGDDLAAPKGTPVYAVAAGTVTAAEVDESLGKYVMLDHGTDENVKTWETEYAHMDTLTVEEGQTVKQGEQIGTVGNTGNSTGEHLHIELHCNGELLAPSEYIDYDVKP